MNGLKLLITILSLIGLFALSFMAMFAFSYDAYHCEWYGENHYWLGKDMGEEYNLSRPIYHIYNDTSEEYGNFYSVVHLEPSICERVYFISLIDTSEEL